MMPTSFFKTLSEQKYKTNYEIITSPMLTENNLLDLGGDLLFQRASSWSKC